MERETVYDRTYLRMRLRNDSEDLRQREERIPVRMKFGDDSVRADVNKMPLPVSTDCSMLALHRIKQALALDMHLPAWDSLERSAWPHLGRNIDAALARSLLQTLANEFLQRFFAGREHENGGV